MTMNGKAIAMAAFGLLLAGSPRTSHADDKTSKTAEIKCAGINSCKGHGSCASASNECKGQNGCKGKGWLMATEKDCKAKGGTVVVEKKPDDKPKSDKPKTDKPKAKA